MSLNAAVKIESMNGVSYRLTPVAIQKRPLAWKVEMYENGVLQDSFVKRGSLANAVEACELTEVEYEFAGALFGF